MATARDRELEYQYRMRRLGVVQVVFNRLITGLTVSSVFLFLYLSVRTLAGRQTFADVEFRALAGLKATRWAAMLASWVLTGSTTVWGLGQRRLRQKNIERHASEISELQKKIDPERRSSGLTLKGKTNAEDI